MKVMVVAWAAVLGVTLVMVLLTLSNGRVSETVTDQVVREVVDGKAKVTRTFATSSIGVDQQPEREQLMSDAGAVAAGAPAGEAPAGAGTDTAPSPAPPSADEGAGTETATTPTPAAAPTPKPAGPKQSEAATASGGATAAAASASVNVQPGAAADTPAGGDAAADEATAATEEKPDEAAPASSEASLVEASNKVKDGITDLVAMLLAFLAVTGLALIAAYTPRKKADDPPPPPPDPRTIADDADSVLVAATEAKRLAARADTDDDEDAVAAAHRAGLRAVAAGEGTQSVAATIGAEIPQASTALVESLSRSGADAIETGRVALKAATGDAAAAAAAAANAARLAADAVTRAVLANYGPASEDGATT